MNDTQAPAPPGDRHRDARHRAIRRGWAAGPVAKDVDPDVWLARGRGAGFADGYAAGFAAARGDHKAGQP